MKLQTIFLLLLVINSCGQKPQEISEYETDEEVIEGEIEEISELRSELPKIKTPIYLNSKRGIELKSANLKNNGIFNRLTEKYLLTTYGKIFETENFITLLGYVPSDSGSPILITLNRQGQVISTHLVFENTIGDIGIYISNFVTITPDRVLHFTDSTLTRQLTEDGFDEIPGTDSLSVTNKKYRILDNGKVEKIK